MGRKRWHHAQTLTARFPASEPCTCPVCVGYCLRPGWWTVDQAADAIRAGYAGRMMLEMSPERSYGVLSPAFKGCELDFARQVFADRGCTFLQAERCELFGSGLEPLECLHCHHASPQAGHRCHAEIGRTWNSTSGRDLIVEWSQQTGFLERVHHIHPGLGWVPGGVAKPPR